VHDAAEADNILVCFNDESALVEKGNKEEPIEASKENCLVADKYEDVSAVHITNVGVSHVAESSCCINKNSSSNCDVDIEAEKLVTAEDDVEQMNNESAEDTDVGLIVTKEVLQLTAGSHCSENDNSVSSTNTAESLEVSMCEKVNECTEAGKSAGNAWDGQDETISKSAQEGGSTPVNKNRKSLDKVINGLVYSSFILNELRFLCHNLFTCQLILGLS
jgi:hypothetical protein